MLKKSELVLAAANLPNFSTGQDGEKRFIREADKWWGDYTAAPAFCAELKKEFNHRVVTDGYSASVVTVRPLPQPGPESASGKRKCGQPAALDDDVNQVWVRGISAEAINMGREAGHRLVGLDPGRRALFTTAVHADQAKQHIQDRHLISQNKYQGISWSHNRWHEESGTREHNAKVDKWLRDAPTVHQVLLATPTAKVATVEAFGSHVSYMSQHAKLVTDHFGEPCHRKMRRKRKIRRQAALQKACNHISQGKGTTIVAYGDAKFSCASKGLAPTPTTAIRRQLGRSCRVCDVDEFRTSMLCCACHRAMPGMPTRAQQARYRGLSRPPQSELPALQHMPCHLVERALLHLPS